MRWRTLLHLADCVVLLSVCIAVPVQRASAAVADPPGTWLMGEKVAIQIFDCGGMLCGRITWLKEPFNTQGLLKRDRHNPDPALRQRGVCGPTIIWNLRSADSNRWEGGWFYNPNDGMTYRTAIELKSADAIVARIYLGYPLFGVARTLIRVSQGTSEGWC
jgi:uncharacterized protein (DUF2147 family)